MNSGNYNKPLRRRYHEIHLDQHALELVPAIKLYPPHASGVFSSR